jgi:hypothetical protein
MSASAVPFSQLMFVFIFGTAINKYHYFFKMTQKVGF